jgi:hypothetical protein
VSRAIDAKMAELMGEMELRLNPGSEVARSQQGKPGGVASEASFDQHVDAAINTLEVA